MNRWKLVYRRAKWTELLQMLENGKIDILPDISFSPERAKRFKLSTIPVLQSWIQIFVPAGSSITSIAGLTGKTVAVLKDSIQDKYLQKRLLSITPGQRIKLLRTADYPASIKAVLNGKADGLAADRFFYFSPHRPDRIVPLPVPLLPANIHYAVSQHCNRTVLKKLDSALLELKNTPDSAFYRTLHRHLDLDFMETPPWYSKPVWLITAGVALLFALFSLLLRIQVKRKAGQLLENRAKLEKSLADKKLLIQELFHRTHNTLQLLSSLSRLQQKGIADNYSGAAFDALRRRMETLTVIHRRLFEEQDLSAIDFSQVIRKTAAAALRRSHLRCRIKYRLQPVKLQLDDAVPAGLIIHELLDNSLKHAWPQGQTGEIEISLDSIAGEQRTLGYRDNGGGFDPGAPRSAAQLGLKLAATVAEHQLQGSLTINSSRKADTGFPEMKQATATHNGMEGLLTFRCRQHSRI